MFRTHQAVEEAHGRLEEGEKKKEEKDTIEEMVLSGLSCIPPQRRPGWADLPRNVLNRGLRAYSRIWWTRNVTHGNPLFLRTYPASFNREAARAYFLAMSHLHGDDIRRFHDRGVAAEWFPAEEEDSADSSVLEMPPHRPARH